MPPLETVHAMRIEEAKELPRWLRTADVQDALMPWRPRMAEIGLFKRKLNLGQAQYHKRFVALRKKLAKSQASA